MDSSDIDNCVFFLLDVSEETQSSSSRSKRGSPSTDTRDPKRIKLKGIFYS